MKIHTLFKQPLLTLLAFASLHVQSISPSPAQIEQFKQLPAAQQQALAKQYGISLPSAGTKNTQIQFSEPVKAQKPSPPNKKPNNSDIESTAKKTTDNINLVEARNSKEVKTPLTMFGYDLFNQNPDNFTPATDIPIPNSYIMGPGDNIVVQLYGKENANHVLTVSREGDIQFPNIGPISVAGLTFSELKATLNQTVEKQMIGVKASITMGSLRSIRVFILGEANNPGSYTVSSLSNITNALLVSGGVSKIGSLRNIQLKRQGDIVTELDLYDLLLNGDTKNDVRLLPGDVIFIPPIGKTVGINGEVRRSAIYEIKHEKNIQNIVDLAGGFLPTAYPQSSRIERINQLGRRTLLDVDLLTQKGKNTTLRDADVIQIFPVLDTMEDVVLVEGHLERPGGFSFIKGQRFTDLIANANELLPNPDLNTALIIREKQPTREISVLLFSPSKAFTKPYSESDPIIHTRDRILIFNYTNDRGSLISEVVKKLTVQANQEQPVKTVKIEGNVRFPGVYPLTDNMSNQDLINLSGGLKQETDLDSVIRIRKKQQSNHIIVSLLNHSKGNTVLEPLDQLVIFHLEDNKSNMLSSTIDQLKWQANHLQPPQIVSVKGNVRFPGEYPLTEDMTASELIQLAGGLTDRAYSLEAEISRYHYSVNKEQNLEHLNLDIQDTESHKLIAEDRLLIKRIPNWVGNESITISGEVAFPGTYSISRGETLGQVLERAGGINQYAFTKAAIFTREELLQNEQKHIEDMRNRLSSDIAAGSVEVQNTTGAVAIADAEKLLASLNKTKAIGRMVINLDKIIEQPQSSFDVTLKNKDRLHIPRLKHSVTVIGEVHFPTSHLYQQDLSVNDYIERSGNPTQKADEARIYVVKADGSVYLPNESNWFSFDEGRDAVESGDTIVVPYDADRMKPLPFWAAVTQIFYQVALSVAAVNSF